MEREIEKQEFWNDNERAQKILQKNKSLKDTIEEYNSLQNGIEEVEILIEMGMEEDDVSIEKEIETSINSLQKELNKMRIKTLLKVIYLVISQSPTLLFGKLDFRKEKKWD